MISITSDFGKHIWATSIRPKSDYDNLDGLPFWITEYDMSMSDIAAQLQASIDNKS